MSWGFGPQTPTRGGNELASFQQANRQGGAGVAPKKTG